MVVQQLDKLLCVEKLLGVLPQKFLLDDVVILVLLQPHTGGHREAQLLFASPFLRHPPQGRLAHGVLGVFLVDPVLQGNAPRQRHDFLIQEGHPQLQGVGHAHLVRF